jgi:hypothetical protein
VWVFGVEVERGSGRGRGGGHGQRSAGALLDGVGARAGAGSGVPAILRRRRWRALLPVRRGPVLFVLRGPLVLQRPRDHPHPRPHGDARHAARGERHLQRPTRLQILSALLILLVVERMIYTGV